MAATALSCLPLSAMLPSFARHTTWARTSGNLGADLYVFTFIGSLLRNIYRTNCAWRGLFRRLNTRVVCDILFIVYFIVSQFPLRVCENLCRSDCGSRLTGHSLLTLGFSVDVDIKAGIVEYGRVLIELYSADHAPRALFNQCCFLFAQIAWSPRRNIWIQYVLSFYVTFFFFFWE